MIGKDFLRMMILLGDPKYEKLFKKDPLLATVQKIIDQLEEVPVEGRSIHAIAAMAVISSNGREEVFQSKISGKVPLTPHIIDLNVWDALHSIIKITKNKTYPELNMEERQDHPSMAEVYLKKVRPFLASQFDQEFAQSSSPEAGAASPVSGIVVVKGDVENEIIIKVEDRVIAYVTEEDPYYLTAKPPVDIDIENDYTFRQLYYASLLEYIHIRVQESGRMVSFKEDFFPELMNATIQGNGKGYVDLDTIDGVETDFAIGNLEGKRIIVGDFETLRRRARPFKLEYRRKGDESTSVMTFKNIGRAIGIRVIPKKTGIT